ncbi:hypothetical protein ABLN67_20800, partial [Mycobacterium tuberculosis]
AAFVRLSGGGCLTVSSIRREWSFFRIYRETLSRFSCAAYPRNRPRRSITRPVTPQGCGWMPSPAPASR